MSKKNLAIHGSAPVRERLLPYGRHSIDEDDIAAVVEVLRSDWLTTGPRVPEFEHAFAHFVGAKHAVAVSNGTAALHAAVHALALQPGDEVIVSTMTFAASANCILYAGATPVFADVDPDTLLIDPSSVERLISARTRAIIAVDYAGQPCDYDALRVLAQRRGIAIIADASHAVGAHYQGAQVGSLADLSTFSLHPVKHFTSGEGGLITTNDDAWAQRMRVFRNHGITSDHRERAERGAFYYEMVDLGYNFRITDFQCALGLSQLRKLNTFVEHRRAIARAYDTAFRDVGYARPLKQHADRRNSYHLYVIALDIDALGMSRDAIFAALRAEGIGVNVHYLPVHLHPYYRSRFGTGPGLCPAAEAAYERILSLPIFPQMSERDVADVIEAVRKLGQREDQVS